MGLFDMLLGNDDKNKDKDKEEKDKYRWLGLDNNQKEEVKKGNYDTWNFEEEDLEDDDYYEEENEK